MYLLANKSFTTGYFPQHMKVAVVRPRLKKSGLDPTLPSNYRPVSNLPFLSKLIEQIVDSQLNSYLSNSNAYAIHQSAYRKFHSTETALLKIHSDICSYIDDGN